jgi:amino acid transporter
LGSAIFIIASSLATELKSTVVILFVWILGGVLTLFGAMSLGELGAMFPRAGGVYAYLREIYGDPLAFLYGWGLLTVIHSGSIAALAVGFSLYSAQLFPMNTFREKLVRVAAVMLLSAINCLGIRAGKIVQNVFSVAKIAGLCGMILVAVSRGSFRGLSSSGFSLASFDGWRWAPFGIALVAVLWAYEGWHMVSFAAAEMKNPKKDLPRGLVLGTLLIMLIYILTNAAYYMLLSPEEIRNSKAVAALAMARVF